MAFYQYFILNVNSDPQHVHLDSVNVRINVYLAIRLSYVNRLYGSDMKNNDKYGR